MAASSTRQSARASTPKSAMQSLMSFVGVLVVLCAVSIVQHLWAVMDGSVRASRSGAPVGWAAIQNRQEPLPAWEQSRRGTGGIGDGNQMMPGADLFSQRGMTATSSGPSSPSLPAGNWQAIREKRMPPAGRREAARRWEMSSAHSFAGVAGGRGWRETPRTAPRAKHPFRQVAVSTPEDAKRRVLKKRRSKSAEGTPEWALERVYADEPLTRAEPTAAGVGNATRGKTEGGTPHYSLHDSAQTQRAKINERLARYRVVPNSTDAEYLSQVFVCVCVYVCMYVCMYMCMYVYVYVCMYVCACVCICMCMHMYLY